MNGTPGAQGSQSGRRRASGIGLGLAALALVLALPPPDGMTPAAWRVAGGALLMAVWWLSEAVPVAATALVPVVLFPLLGVARVEEAAAHYANPLIFLFLGGFLIALAMQRWGLHRRIALHIVRFTGTAPAALVGGFMLASAFLSMWVSNTATAVMMLPIGLSVIRLARPDGEGETDGFAPALLLGIAYAASIGGLATLIGTPPNALLAAFLGERLGRAVGFAEWMLVGLPVSLAMLLAAWLLLTRALFRIAEAPLAGTAEVIRAEIAALGPLGREERAVAVVFAMVALAWMLRPALAGWLPGLSDAGIALLGALALFALPSDLSRGAFVMDWEATASLPWGVLVLFGGGLSLAAAIQDSGLAAWLGLHLEALGGLPTVLVVVLVTALVVFLTELTSNTATAATFLPLMAALAGSLGLDPALLAAAAALAASCAFMMPVATPPNAIVFGSGLLTVPTMARAGLRLNLVAIAVITAAAYGPVAWVLAAQSL